MLYITSDHAGFALKTRLIRYVQKELEREITDLGPAEYDEHDDYPDTIIPATEKAVQDGARIIVIGGSGNGEQIAANKVTGMRCALGYNIQAAELASSHNNANGLALGARLISEDHAMAMVKAWLETPFSGDERHVRRLKKLAEYEKGGQVSK